jgi:putative hemolysin
MFHTISRVLKLMLTLGIAATLASCAPQPTFTPTPLPATATPIPTQEPTLLPHTPVSTDTPVPPSATPAPPTATPIPPTPTQEPAGKIANPASENCAGQGGRLVIQKRGDGGEYGVCLFEDNRQCEEWAMFHGECPVGGIKVTGYVTPAAQYCAITGGEYQVTGNSNTDQEQGTCTFKNGQTCDVWDYFAGKCNPNTGAEPSS